MDQFNERKKIKIKIIKKMKINKSLDRLTFEIVG